MARKGENIYRRKDGRWEGRYVKSRSVDGRPKHGSVYGKTYGETKKRLLGKRAEALLAQEQSQEENSPSADCFGLVARQWLASTKKNIKESTYNKYTDFLNKHILPRFGKMVMRLINEQALEAFAAAKLSSGRLDGAGGLSPKTVADMLSVVKQVFRYAKISMPEIKVRNPAPQMAAFSANGQQRLTTILFQDMDLYKLGVLICLHTGIRVGELCALTWKDIDLRENVLRIHSTMQRLQDHSLSTAAKTKIIVTAPKSQCSVRDIPLPGTLVNLLRKFARGQNPDAYFLSGSKSVVVEPRAMQYRFKSYLNQAGVAAQPFHALRHTFASNWVERGLEVKCLSQILGHSSVKITLDRYVHTSMDLKRSQMEQMGDFLGANHPASAPLRGISRQPFWSNSALNTSTA